MNVEVQTSPTVLQAIATCEIVELLFVIGQVAWNTVIPDDPQQMRANVRDTCGLIRDLLEELEGLLKEEEQ